jgi:hypothetical protein
MEIITAGTEDLVGRIVVMGADDHFRRDHNAR